MAASALVVLAALVPENPAQAAGDMMLPDLRQGPVGCAGGYPGDPAECSDWDVCMVADAAAPNGDCVDSGPVRTVRLRFTATEDNVGAGPLLIYGHRDGTGRSTMDVRQAFQVGEHGTIPDSFAAAQRAVPNSMYYEPATMHQHWHLLNFERYQLRTPDGRTVVTDRKNGVCLGDRYATADADRLPQAVGDGNTPEDDLSRELSDQNCNFRDPSATDVTEGISVGRGDDYRYGMDFQWLDITRLPSGTYNVVNIANPDRTLLETNYDNDASSIAISVQWPGGARTAPRVITAPPTVTLRKSCPGSDRCG